MHWIIFQIRKQFANQTATADKVKTIKIDAVFGLVMIEPMFRIKGNYISNIFHLFSATFPAPKTILPSIKN